MTANPVIPNHENRNTIETFSDSRIRLCWTCGTCDNECPVFAATERLNPRKIVRMASLGMLEDLIHLPEIWYCLTCTRCQQVCPNLVKPFDLIQYLKEEVIRRKRVSSEFVLRLKELMGGFQRIRLRAVGSLMRTGTFDVSEQTWFHFHSRPVKKPSMDHFVEPLELTHSIASQNPFDANYSACATCSECSSCCPVFSERDVFDPQKIIRMVQLGLSEELCSSPSIWLCINCKRCSDACSQSVNGHDIIRYHQQLAIEKGIVPDYFPVLIQEADRKIFPRLLDEIDMLFGLYAGTGKAKAWQLKQ